VDHERDTGRHFATDLIDVRVFLEPHRLDYALSFVLTLDALPRESSQCELEQDVAECLEVVPSGVFEALHGVDARVACSAGHVVSVFEGNVFPIRLFKLRAEPEVD